MAQRGHNIDPTSTDIGQKEVTARNTLESRYTSERASEVNGPQDVHVRDLNPGLDFESGSDNTDAVDDSQFIQSGLTSGDNVVYDIDSDAKMDNKMMVIVALTIRGTQDLVEVRFRTSPGGVFERVMVQGGYTDEEATVLLQNPIYYGLGDDGSILHEMAAGGDSEVIYHGFVAEKSGSELAKVPSQFITSSSRRGTGGGSTGGGA